MRVLDRRGADTLSGWVTVACGAQHEDTRVRASAMCVLLDNVGSVLLESMTGWYTLINRFVPRKGITLRQLKAIIAVVCA